MPVGASETEPEAAIARGAYLEGTGKGERGLRRRVTGVPSGATVTGQLSINHHLSLVQGYNRLVVLFALVFVVLGVAILVRTAQAGGGIGYVIGVLFIALGAGRVYLRLRR